MVQKDGKEELCEGIERLGQCPEGKIPFLSTRNHAFWALFERMLPGLIRDRGYDYGAIRLIFDVSGLTRHRRAIYIDMIIAVIDVIHKAREKKSHG